MKNQVRAHVRECDVCQRSKYENVHLAGLLHPLPIPDQVWEEITMDFIEGLPKSGGRTTILVVVDRLSKFAHFIPLSHPFTARTVALVYIDHIYKLYGMPQVIVTDRDPLFTSELWREFWQLQGSQLNFSTSSSAD